MSKPFFGALLLSLSVLFPVASAQAQAVSGELLFKQRCQACHAVKVGAPSLLAPSLAGVAGRKAASAKFTYSAALKASNLVWTPANLDKFLSGPTKMVPGTRMVIAVSDSAQRAALVAYLAKLK